MKVLKSNLIELNNQRAKICIPLTGNTEDVLMTRARAVKTLRPDIVEWRADSFVQSDCYEWKQIERILERLAEILMDIPMIFTLRTMREGGSCSISADAYRQLCLDVAKRATRCHIDFIDVEVFEIADAKGLIRCLHQYGVKVIGSNHHFEKTFSFTRLCDLFCIMEQTGADICKLAVMPEKPKDVQTLIQAAEWADHKLKVPIIAISMSQMGAVTRVCTKLTGSVLTFAAGVDASAPGQPSIEILRELLTYSVGHLRNKNLVLVGFMGVGKTTIAQTLSYITGLRAVDVDAYISEEQNMSVRDIFENRGEAYFRDLETEALRNIATDGGQIISCGGGAVLRDENIKILKKTGVIVLLQATPETIFKRVKNQTGRPVLNQEMSISNIRKLLNSRESYYQNAADVIINSDGGDTLKICCDILKKICNVE